MPEIVKKNPVNDPTQKPVKTHSKFEPSYSAFVGHQFGVATPHFAMAGVADDDISMRVSADADTYTLKAPMMVPIKRNMDYFQLPLRALLPNGAELLITNPLRGDDVVAANVNAVVSASGVGSWMSTVFAPILSTHSTSLRDAILNVLLCYQPFQMAFSKGSLINHLGMSCFSDHKVVFSVPVGSLTQTYTLDLEPLFNYVFQELDDYIAHNEGFLEITLEDYKLVNTSSSITVSYTTKSALIGKDQNQTLVPDNTAAARFKTVRAFIEWLMECNMRISNVSTSSLGGDKTNLLSGLISSTDGALLGMVKYVQPGATSVSSVSHSGPREPLNILRLVAYQKACAEFYTNDKVDAIYSAKLWEANMLAICHGIAYQKTILRNYIVNGVPVLYDACAGHYIYHAMDSVTASPTNNLTRLCWIYLHNLFSFNRSLKYEDYFVGAKTQPLAVGDVTVGVDTSTNTIDIVDVTKRIQVQRFLNQVNRVGRKFSDYVKGILGDKPMKDAHEPIFLGHVVDTIGAEETENTGADQFTKQNSVTSKLRNNSSRFGFDVHIGEPSILIGITTYDIPRAYQYVVDRETYHIDRYEAFNPYMQFVGDQEIFYSELHPENAIAGQIFGYTMRYMEYKQRVDRAVGPFAAGVLPGYAKVISPSNIPAVINSDFLRSHVGEIDEFYQILSGYTPSDLFQFIVRLDISVTARRPMAFAPSIL